jgi:hypothetical protein
MKTTWLLFLGMLVLIVGCSGKKAKMPSKNSCPASMSAPAIQEKLSSGIIVQMLNASSYTYVRIAEGADTFWAAAPQFTAKPGDTVEFSKSMPMLNYQSKTLKRTFDTVYFNGSIQRKGANACPPGMGGNRKCCPPQAPQSPRAGISDTSNQVSFNYTGIKKPPHGKTVSELFEQKDALVGKKVSLCAKVIKANYHIMNKNWYHLRDGTGENGLNDLTMTSDESLKVGDIVQIEGVLTKDKDIGSGYNFPLIIEDAKAQIQK